MSCLKCIIEVLSGNDYKIPHMNKERMEQKGALPVVLDVSDAAAEMFVLTDAAAEMFVLTDDNDNDMMDVDNNILKMQTPKYKRIPC